MFNITFIFPFQGGYPRKESPFIASTPYHQMYGNYNQISMSHQQQYYCTPPNFTHSQLCFPSPCPVLPSALPPSLPPPPPLPPQPPPPPPPPPPSPPPPSSQSYSNIGYHASLDQQVVPPPIPTKDNPPVPSTNEPEYSADRVLPDGKSDRNLSVLKKVKCVGKSRPSAPAHKLHSNLRYPFHDITKNKLSRDVLKIIDRALRQSPTKTGSPSPASSVTSSSYSPVVQSPTKESRMLENRGEQVSVSGTSSKIDTYKARKSVARNPEVGIEVKAVRDVILEQGLHILSRNQKQLENKNLNPVQNKSESSKLKMNLKRDFRHCGVKSSKHSGHSQAPTTLTDGHKPLRRTLKPLSLSPLAYRSAHKSASSLLGESDADCTMFSSVNLEATSSEGTTKGVMSKETNIIETKDIPFPPSRTLREREPIQQKIPPRSNLCSVNDSQSNEGDTELLSTSQTESSKHGSFASVEQDGVNNLQQALIVDTKLDQEIFESEKVDKSKLESTDSIDMKLKTLPKNTATNEVDNVISKVLEVEPITSIHNTVLSALSTENSKNEWPDDNTRKSVPVETSVMLQVAEAKLPVSRITGSSDVVNSADSSVCSTSAEQTNCSVKVKPIDDAVQEQQLQVVNGNDSIGEWREPPANKEDANGHSSEFVHENMRNISLPVTGSETPAVLLTEHSTVEPQDGRKVVTAHGKEIKEVEAVVSGKGSTEECAVFSVTSNKNMAPVSEAEFECGIQDTESDPEEKLVQTALMIETGGKEIVTAVSENECKGEFELKDAQSDPEEEREQTSLMFEKGSKEMVTAISENEYKGSFELGGEDGSSSSSTMNESASKDSSVWTVAITLTENSGNEKISPSVAHVSETVDTEMTTIIHVTAASELGSKNKLSSYEVFTSLPGRDGVKLAGSEEMIDCIPETQCNKTPVPKCEYKEGSTGSLEAVTCVGKEDNVRAKTALSCVPEESNKQMTAPEGDNKEEPTSLLKAAMYVPAEQSVKQAATLKTEVLGEDPAPVVPDVASDEASSLLLETEYQVLNGEGCKAEGSENIERNVCNETALPVTNEVKFPLSVADKFTLHCTDNFEVSSVQEGLLIESPVELPEDTSQVEIKVQPELNKIELSVSPSSEVDTLSHLQSTSPSENKENLPVTSSNTSVLEHAKLPGSSSGNTQLQPLNNTPVTQNVLEETLMLPCGEISRTETNKFNISGGSGRPEANVEMLELSISVHETVDSPRPSDLQNNLQVTSTDCDTSTVIQAKNIKTCSKKSYLVESTSKVIKLSTANGIKSRKNVNSTHSTLKDKSRSVEHFTKHTKKSVISKSGNLKKQAETSCVDDRGAKLGSTKMRELSSPTSARNCDILGHSETSVSRSSSGHKNCDSLVHSETAVIPAMSKCKNCDGLVHSDAAVSESSSRHESFERLVGSGTTVNQASLKCVKESGLSSSDTRILASEVTTATSEKTVCDSIKSEKCFKKLTTPGEPFHRERSQQTMRKKHKCHRLNDNLLTCLKDSALLNGKWPILFSTTLWM